jgi:sulfur relay (sulfurtransferase) DsrF/TusC family protein
MEHVAILLTREPYGDIGASEAVRHTMGAVGSGLTVSLLLTDGGVLLAAKGQAVGDTGFSNLGEALGTCFGAGVSVYAERESLAAAQLGEADIMEGVRVVDRAALPGLLREAEHTIIF